MDGTLWYTHSQRVQFRDTISLAPLLKEAFRQVARRLDSPILQTHVQKDDHRYLFVIHVLLDFVEEIK